jgi:hypothetical protein
MPAGISLHDAVQTAVKVCSISRWIASSVMIRLMLNRLLYVNGLNRWKAARCTMMRFEKTDFRDSNEMISMAQLGILPKSLSFRPTDKVIHSVDLAAVGITGGEEYKKAMRRFITSMQ